MTSWVRIHAEMVVRHELQLGRSGGEHARLGHVRVVDLEVQVHPLAGQALGPGAGGLTAVAGLAASRASGRTGSNSSTTFPGRIFEQDLLGADAGHDLVPEMSSGRLEPVDGAGQIRYLDHEPVPSARLLPGAVGHRP